jgi:glycine cleavage system H protein
VSVKAPLSGEVVEVNLRLREEPELVHRDPYGAGWLLRLRPSALDRERVDLVTGDAIAPAMAEHARLFRLDT